jgi:phosphodiesterase/alkaline phosphatase D-like protein
MQILVGPLLRAVSSTCATIWVEVSQPAFVSLLLVSPDDPDLSLSLTTPTVPVGGYFYATLQIATLRPFTWYSYKLIITTQDHSEPKSTISSDSYDFRTLSSQTAPSSLPGSALRVAYGSCRNLAHPKEDTLSAYGDWLAQHVAERDTLWPQALLLIGDQIYADEIPPQNDVFPEGQAAALTFADFATLYRYVWTNTPGIRSLLAHIPSFMIFDDHEITNNWNHFPGWRALALREGQEQLLVDGMVAYWIYQGWGNLLPDEATPHPLLATMQEAAQSGEDALETLRAHIRDEVYGKTALPWHYTIPTTPPIFVIDARTGRSVVFSTDEADSCVSARIMGHEQTNHLRNWLQAQSQQPALLVSSVPILLPPLIAQLEYLMGWRPLQHSRFASLRRLGLSLALRQLRLTRKLSFDHWAVFVDSWDELRGILEARAQAQPQAPDVLVFSGDVHFSYAAVASPFISKQRFRLYQFVCSPFENELDTSSERQIRLQSYLGGSAYGGLFTRTLPLHKLTPTPYIARGYLFQRAVAEATIQLHDDGGYTAQQEYLGFVDGTFQVLARTTVENPSLGKP